MKMADLTVNSDYLQSRETAWRDNDWRASRVVVLSTDRIVTSLGRYGSNRDEAPTMQFVYDGVAYTVKARKAGTFDRVDHVLVLHVNRDTGQPAKDATPTWAPLRDLRGPWAETWAAVQERKATLERQRTEAAQRKAAGTERLAKAVAALSERGVDMPPADPYRLHVQMDAKVLEQIITLLDA